MVNLAVDYIYIVGVANIEVLCFLMYIIGTDPWREVSDVVK